MPDSSGSWPSNPYDDVPPSPPSNNSSDTSSRAVGGFGAIFSAVGAMVAAGSKAANFETQATAYTRSAFGAMLAAGDAIQRAHYAGTQARMQGGLSQGQQQAAESVSGVVVGVGSAQTDADRTRSFSDINAQMIENNAAKEAYGLRAKSADDLVQASVAKSNASSSIIGGALSAAGSMLNFAGSAAS